MNCRQIVTHTDGNQGHDEEIIFTVTVLIELLSEMITTRFVSHLVYNFVMIAG